MNPYVYGLNNPMTLIDVSGLSPMRRAQFNLPPASFASADLYISQAPMLTREQKYDNELLMKGVEKYTTILTKGIIDVAIARIALIPGIGPMLAVVTAMIVQERKLERELEPLAKWIASEKLKTEQGRQFLRRVGKGEGPWFFEFLEDLNRLKDKLRESAIPPELIMLFE
jgi:hypothetical protein